MGSNIVHAPFFYYAFVIYPLFIIMKFRKIAKSIVTFLAQIKSLMVILAFIIFEQNKQLIL
jgi:hypothetical protein